MATVRRSANVMVALIFSAVLMVAFSAPQAKAEDGWGGVRDQLTKYNVPKPTQEILIQKITAGEEWDSLSGSSPVNTTKLPDGTLLERYSDGSVSTTKVEQPVASENSSVAPLSKAPSRCKALPYKNGYKRRANCLVSRNSVVINYSFEADYKVKSGAPGYITGARHPNAWVLVPGGGYSTPGPKITRSKSSGKIAATARMNVKVTTPVLTSNAWVQLNVTTSAWVTHS